MNSLIFPAYNPGSLIERTWYSVRDFLRARPDPWEVVFVCDGCTDGTPERLQQLASEPHAPPFRIVSYSPNRGKGYAVRRGLLEARGDRRIFTDIDLAYRFDEIARLADELRAGADVAIASREHPESTLQLPPRFLGYAYRRRIQSFVFGSIARTLLPLTQHDTQAGLKGMTAEVAEKIAPVMQCDGFGFDCELLTACARHNISVVEIPVCVRYEDAASTTGMKATLKMLRDLWRIRKNWPSEGFPIVQGERTADTKMNSASQAA